MLFCFFVRVFFSFFSFCTLLETQQTSVNSDVLVTPPYCLIALKSVPSVTPPSCLIVLKIILSVTLWYCLKVLKSVQSVTPQCYLIVLKSVQCEKGYTMAVINLLKPVRFSGLRVGAMMYDLQTA